MVRSSRRFRPEYNAIAAVESDDAAAAAAANTGAEIMEVFVDEDDDDDDDIMSPSASSTTTPSLVGTSSNNTNTPLPRRGLLGRRQLQQQRYETVRSTDEQEQQQSLDIAKEDDVTVLNTAAADDDADDKNSNDDRKDVEDTEQQEGKNITLVIMDPAQKKFLIKVNTAWSVAMLKKRGEKVHKVGPASQRLIYRGQLLQDHQVLEQIGLNKDNLILHLFPKPRVVIHNNKKDNEKNNAGCSVNTSQDSGSTASNNDDNDDDDDINNNNSNDNGAHIPQIVLNADEAEQRASILVLGSSDFLEAQNNVKLFSFLLMVISSIELFNLLLILMGVPPDGTQNQNNSYDHNTMDDDIFHIETNATTTTTSLTYSSSSNNNAPYQGVDPYEQAQLNEEMQTWHPRNNVDLIISAVGVYVALLGIRATNETTLRVAKHYLIGTVVVGVAWMAYNSWFTVHVDQEFDQMKRDERHNHTFAPANGTDADNEEQYGASDMHYDDDDIPYKTDWEYYQQNMSLMMIPGMVWILCCVRAWQFQHLLEEAEQEAQERIRNELEQHRVIVTGNVNGNGNGPDEEENNNFDVNNNADEEMGRGRGRGNGDLFDITHSYNNY